MNFLPIILIVLFLLNRNDKTAEFMKDFDFQSISPLLSLFGINQNLIEMISSPEVKNLLQGNIDIKSLTPLLTTLLSSIKQNNQNDYKSEENPTFTAEYLNPIKEVASEEVFSSLNSFFEN